MVDMVQTSSLVRFRQTIGTLDANILELVEESLLLHLGLDG